MKYKISFIFLIILSIFFFVIGAYGMYLLFKYTTFVKPDYNYEFEKVYTSQTKMKGYETFIDLRRNYMFQYPNEWTVDQKSYTPFITRDTEIGSGGLVSLQGYSGDQNLATDPTTQQLYDKWIKFVSFRLAPNESLKDFARNRDFYTQILPDEAYSQTNINGQEALIVDFSITPQIYEKGKQIMTGKPLYPSGYRSKVVYIKYGNYVFQIISGNLYSEDISAIYDKVITSFKLVNPAIKM